MKFKIPILWSLYLETNGYVHVCVYMHVCMYVYVVFMYVPLLNTYYWPDIVLHESYVCVYYKVLINN